MSPGFKGSDNFLKGITDDFKQHYRERLFDVNKDQLKAAAEKYAKDCSCNVSTHDLVIASGFC